MKKLIFLILFFTAKRAFAQAGVIDDTIHTFTSVLKQVEDALRPNMTALFWTLATLSFIWSFIQWALNANDMRSFVAEFARKILIIGFFSACLSYSGEWSAAIINSFKAWAGIASQSVGGHSNIAPSFILDSALSVVGQAVSGFDFLNLGVTLITSLVAIAILLCFAALVGVMVLTLVEAQFVALFNMILFAIGGSDFTVDYAKSSWRYTVSVGLKVFTVFLLVAVGEGIMINALAAAEDGKLQALLGTLVSSFVLLVIVKQIPDTIQSVVAGVTLTGSHNTAQTITQLATGTAGMAMMMKEAVKYGAIQSGGNPAKFVAHAASAMTRAASSDVADKLKGAPGSSFGSFGGRIASRISQSSQSLKGATIKPVGNSQSPSTQSQTSSSPYISPLNNYNNSGGGKNP